MDYRIGLVAGLLSYMLMAWLAATLFGLTGVDLWIVRGLLALVGITGAGIFYWYLGQRKNKQRIAGGMPGEAGGGNEADLLVRDAEARLATSDVAKGARIANLPAIFVLGPASSAKTNTVIHSGLEPELLSGQVYQDNAVAPTRGANLWFARQHILIEAGGTLTADAGRWMSLVRRAAPGKLSSALGGGQNAPRAAVVCFDLEEFMKPGGADAAAAHARSLHARLGEISELLGISFPVYVMFTKADRVPFFLDYVRNLTNEEAGQVFGATLPILNDAAGVYAEQATRRLSAAFDNLFYSLCDKRVEFLSREHAADKLPGTYEFPREFRKLRTALVQFLVDLSKPSQLRAAPFLRGFYFSGVRPVVVNEVVQPAVPAPPVQQPGFKAASSATGVFKAPAQPAAAAPRPPQVTGSRRVPQWLFLTHFWNDIILSDRAAVDTSAASVKPNGLRRALLATAAGLCLLYSLALVISYARNRGLESRVADAAAGAETLAPAGQELPSAGALKRLEALRQELVTLTAYERDGAPLSMRWGLYTGSELYPEAYRLYFGRFHSLLFGNVQASMLDSLRRLPASPTPADAYGPPYNALKAYLITTSEWKRSTRAFLSPYLSGRWSEGRNVDGERLQLAQKQFDFYSDELAVKNPFSTDNEGQTVEHARAYLKQFNADERIYQALVEEASKRVPAINYNKLFPNEAVSDGREVRGAFTKDGYAFMQAAFRKPDQMFGGEDWVLGPQSFAGLDRAQLEQKLRGFYTRDFIQAWREFLRNASVARYASLSDAAKKLSLMSSGQSPLLALVCLAAQNTAIDAPEVKTAFQAVQQAVPPGCQSQYVGGPNQNYMGSLLRLQNSVQQVAGSSAGPNDPAAGMTIAQANEALLATGQMAQTFGVDKEGNVPATVQKLLEDPITQVQRLLKGMGPAELRAKGQALCGQFNQLMAKYPFNLKSATQASIDDVNRFFRPGDGALWQFYSQSLQPLLEKMGAQYTPKAGGTMTVTPQFLAFFNRAAAFAEAAYPNGAQQPRIYYTLKSDLSGTNQSIALTLDGQTLSNGGGKSAAMKFAWPGNPPGANLQVKFGGEAFNWPRYDGVWAAFEFFGDSEERTAPAGSVYRLEWTLRTGQSQRVVTTGSGQPVSVRFDLDMMGAPPIFRKGYFSGWACVADVAR
jgi:type VI secretion system protein ImpL